MVCKKCNASLADDYTVCPYCGSELKGAKASAPKASSAKDEPENPQKPAKSGPAIPPPPEVAPLIGKKYLLSSTPGMRPGAFGSKITTEISVEPESLRVAVSPAKYGFNGTIKFADISRVVLKVRPSGQYIFFALIAIVLGIVFWGESFQVYNDFYCPTWIFFILGVLLVLRGINRAVIVASDKPDAMPLVCTVGSRARAEAFYKDMLAIQEYGKALAGKGTGSGSNVGEPDADAVRAQAEAQLSVESGTEAGTSDDEDMENETETETIQ